MPARMLRWVAVVSMLAIPLSARSADDPPKKAPAAVKGPTLVVRIKSINDLISDGKYIAALAGQEDKAAQAEGFLNAMSGENGLGGIDTKRPIGVYGSVSPDLVSSSGVILVPIADEKTLLDLLENYTINATKGNDDIYTVTAQTIPIPVPIYLRFANKYAYITAQNKNALAKNKLMDPESVLSTVRPTTVSARFHIDQIPDFVKEMALAQMELRMAEEQEKKVDGETKAQTELRKQLVKHVQDHAVRLLKEGGEVEFYFDVDRKANQLVTQFTVAGKPGSALAKGFADLAQSQSLFGGLAGDHAALNVLAHVALPEEIRKGFVQAIHEGLTKAMEKEKDEAHKEQAKKLMKALEPTAQAGELDAAVTLRRPTDAKNFTLVIGVKVKEGQGIQSALEDLIQNLPAHDREKIKLNAESAGDVKIHRIEAQKDFDAHARQMLGDNPMYLAIRPDAVLLAGGQGGLEALKTALTTSPKTAPQIQVEASVASLAPATARGDAKALEELKKAAEASFKDKEADKVRFTLEGGQTLKARFTMDGAVVKFISLVSQNPVLQELNKSAKESKASKKSEGE